MFPVFAVKFAMNSELVSVVSKLSFAVSSVLMLLVMFTGLFATVVFVPDSPLTSVIFTFEPLEVMSVCGGVAAFAKNVGMKIAAKIAVVKDENMAANLVFGLEILSLSLFLRENFDVLKLDESLVLLLLLLLLFFLCLMKKMIARMIAAMPSVSKMVVKRLVWAKSVSVLRKPVDGVDGVPVGGVLGSG